jgi:PHD/YefM family antitoxin component YafN of YafNO toxin-antitoxin module
MAKTLSINVNDIRSVTDFQRNAKTHITRLKRTKAPMVLTVNGSASVIVQDANSYQQLRDRIDALEYEHDVVAGIRVGLADVEAGREHPAREVMGYRGR